VDALRSNQTDLANKQTDSTKKQKQIETSEQRSDGETRASSKNQNCGAL
jgi:hypothetical protein